MMKAPTNAPCQLESMPAISSALRITSRKAEPTTAPKAENFFFKFFKPKTKIYPEKKVPSPVDRVGARPPLPPPRRS